MAAKKEKKVEIEVLDIETGRVSFDILGVTPLIYNAMSFKSKQTLLLPSGRKSTAEKANTLKHNPPEEYRASVYRRLDGEEGPTRLVFPAAAFKRAIIEVAGRVPGGVKAEIKQLTWVEDMTVDVYGMPQLLISVVRSADMNKTPDMRTRAILPQWACRVSIRYVQPMLSGHTIAKLTSAAGLLMGIGDFRQEKGAGSFGQFEVVDENDLRFARVLKEGGMKTQDAALAEPDCYDQETRTMLDWFNEEVAKRRDKVDEAPATRQRKRA